MIQFFKKNSLKKLRLILTLYVIVIQIVVSSQQNLEKLKQFTDRMQSNVKNLSHALSKIYQSNCTQSLLNCSVKSYNFCQGTGPRTCIKNFPTPSGCLGAGIKLSLNSSIRYPNIFIGQNLSANLREFICATAQIQKVFQDIQDINTIQYSYSYIGSSTGALRVFPSFKDIQNKTKNQCIDFDPRIRPWYVSAITGPKTTIILIDISKSMISSHPGIRFRNAKVTLQILINTLSRFDYVGVVAFSSTAKTVVYKQVRNATEEVKKQILSQLSNIMIGDGKTNYFSAIQKGMQMLQNSASQSFKCTQIVFLLLTDGNFEFDDQESSNYTTLSNLIDEKLEKLNRQKQNFKLISFVYGLKINIDFTIIKQLTCEYNGIIFRMQDNVDKSYMIQSLTSYYIFLSQGVKQQDIKPLWSQSYIDAFGFGVIYSITMPIYVPSRKINKIIGVAAIDVLMSKFQQLGFDKTFMDNYFLQNNSKCFKINLQKQYLCYLRKRQSDISCDPTCPLKFDLSSQEECNSHIIHDIFLPPSDDTQDQRRCCIMPLTLFFTILFSTLASVILLVILVFLYIKKKPSCLFERLRRKKEADLLSSESARSLNNDKKVIRDPEQKYKKAMEEGITLYYQSQFKIQ